MSLREMELRPVTPDDAAGVADLETARTPDDPQDGAMIAFWWEHDPEVASAQRLVGERDGAIAIFIEATHGDWSEGERRYGRALASIDPAVWTEDHYRRGIRNAEAWLRAEGAAVSVATVRDDFSDELAALARLGYREERRQRYWELDLVANRDRLLAAAERSRAEMRRQKIEMLTLDQLNDPDVAQKLFELEVETTRDVPTTVPFPVPTYELWFSYYFENPGIRQDRFWIACSGNDVAGMSMILFPPQRGIPMTEYTATSPRFRSRGIARALKYETVAQAIAIGATRVRTDNDSENAPILHINAEMGYRPITPYVELHCELGSERE